MIVRLSLFNIPLLREMTTRDIQDHLKEIFSVDASSVLISNVTFALFEDVKAKRTRPLSKVYPIFYLDALGLVSIKVIFGL